MRAKRKRYYEEWKRGGGLERRKIRQMQLAIEKKLRKPLIDERFRPVYEKQKEILSKVLEGKKIRKEELKKWFDNVVVETIERAGGVE